MKKLSLIHAAITLGICLFTIAPSQAQETSLATIQAQANSSLELLASINPFLSNLSELNPACDIVDGPGQQHRAINCNQIPVLKAADLQTRYLQLKDAFLKWHQETKSIVDFLDQGGLGNGYIPGVLNAASLATSLEFVKADAGEFFYSWPQGSTDNAHLTKRLQGFRSIVLESSDMEKIKKALVYLNDENLAARIESERKLVEERQNASEGWFKGCVPATNRPPR